MRACFVISAVGLVLGLAGCAGSPLIKFEAPGFTATGGAPAAMPVHQARDHLFRLRGAYREAMSQQLDATQFSGSGLVVLGAAVAGMAAGGAHRDAVLGTSLLGGTAYAVGNLMLDRRRVLAFDAGIRALDCANAAVIPLDLPAERFNTLRKSTQELRSAWEEASRASKAFSAVAASKAPPDKELNQVADDARGKLDEAGRTLRSAERVVAGLQEVGGRLYGTVLTISAQVDAFIAQTVPDLSAVPQVVGSLGSFAAALAPGAGVDKALVDGLARAKREIDRVEKSNKGFFVAGSPASGALNELDRTITALSQAVSEVNAALSTIDIDTVISGLKGCKVEGVTLPLVAEPAKLSVVADGSPAKGFAIRGGTKPYMVRWLDAVPVGLTLAFTGGFADSAQVSAAQGVSIGGYRLEVSDSTGKSIQLEVSVTAKSQ